MSGIPPRHTTTESTAAGLGPAVPPATRFRRVAGGLSLIAAGAVTFTGILATPWESMPTTSSYLQALAESPGRGQVAAVLLHYGYLLLLPAGLALANLTRHRAVRLGHVGLVLTVIGAGLSGILVVDFYDLALAQNLPLDQAAALSDRAGEYPGLAAIALPSLVGLALGTVLLAVAVWRAGWVSWWVPALVFVGFAVLVFLPQGGLGAAVGTGLLLLGLASLGVRVLRLSDEQWHDGRPTTAQPDGASPARTRPDS